MERLILDKGSVFHQVLAELIDKDVSIPQIARRNVLHEMMERLSVDLFFSFQITNFLCLKLLPITGVFGVDDFLSRWVVAVLAASYGCLDVAPVMLALASVYDPDVFSLRHTSF